MDENLDELCFVQIMESTLVSVNVLYNFTILISILN